MNIEIMLAYAFVASIVFCLIIYCGSRCNYTFDDFDGLAVFIASVFWPIVLTFIIIGGIFYLLYKVSYAIGRNHRSKSEVDNG